MRERWVGVARCSRGTERTYADRSGRAVDQYRLDQCRREPAGYPHATGSESGAAGIHHGDYSSATPGQIPGAFTYVPAPAGIDIRNTVANVAGGVSTAAGRFNAATTVAAQISSPYSPGLIAASYAGTTAGMVADAIAQMARLDMVKYWTSSIVGIAANAASRKVTGLSPAINETENIINSGGVSQSAWDFTDSYR